jgi:antirestriction protein ArdC
MNTDELIEHVTNDLIAAIENGADTWHMPWHTIATNAQPRSIDDRPYRGLNAVVLALTAAANGWPSGTWGTYRGWQRHGAQVRRGERATHVLLWKPARPAKERDDSPNESDDTDTSSAPRGRLVSRVFAVFAAEQVDGADSTLTDIQGVEGKAKLSQNRSDADRLGVIDGLRQQPGHGEHAAIANAMGAIVERRPDGT